MFGSLKPSAVRLAVAAVIATTALVAFAGPASAAKGGGGGKPPGPTHSSTSIALYPSEWANPNTCTFDATYTWSGVKGGGLTMSAKLFDNTGAVVANAPQVQGLTSSGNFTYTFWFTGAPGPQRTIYVRGVLLSNGVEVAGSAATSTVTATTCGSPVSVSWVQTIPIT